jgi:hypothetical protein
LLANVVNEPGLRKAPSPTPNAIKDNERKYDSFHRTGGALFP